MNTKKIIAYITFLASAFLLSSSANAALTIPNPLGGINNFCALLTNIATGVGMFVASLGTMMIVVSGIMYLLSAGSPERINKAKTALIYAVAGLAIGIGASTIVAIVKEILKVAGSTC